MSKKNLRHICRETSGSKHRRVLRNKNFVLFNTLEAVSVPRDRRAAFRLTSVGPRGPTPAMFVWKVSGVLADTLSNLINTDKKLDFYYYKKYT